MQNKIFYFGFTQVMVTTVCPCVAQGCYFMQWVSIHGWLAKGSLTAMFHDLYDKMLLSTQLGFVVGWDCHATHGISFRMIGRLTHKHCIG